jgi:nucleoside-diphosphate-sugar epimerase
MSPAGGELVAITGAYGYLGSVLRDAFDAAGWSSRALVRSPRGDDPAAVPFHLGERMDRAALDGVDVLVHCAYDLRLTKPDAIRQTNVEGTRLLLEAAEQAGVPRRLVISSIAAYEGTSQVYGRAKLAIEAVARRHGAVVVRPGLVYGPHSGAMVGALRKIVALPAVPLLAGRSHQFMVHEADLADAVLELATATSVPDAPVTVAHARPVPFREVLATIAEADGRAPRLVPLPWRAAYIGLRAAEMAGLRPPFKADSLWGLAHPPPPPGESGRGTSPRPFTSQTLREAT